MKKSLSFYVWMILFLLSSIVMAKVPYLLPVQGVLSDPDTGNIVKGSVEITFSIYASELSDTPLWSETYDGDNKIDLDNGAFTVYLGNINALDPGTIINIGELWLGVSVEDDDEMPRIRLASVPFALEAEVCKQVGTLTADDINSNFIPVSSPVSHITSTNISNWTKAYEWGDHSGKYLSATSDAAAVTSTEITNWNTAYGWGDHSGKYLSATSDAAAVTSTEITNWNTAYGWGDPSTKYALKAHTHGSADIDAYQDLSDSGRLNNNNSTDLLTRTQLDARYINVTGEVAKTYYYSISALTFIDNRIVRKVGSGVIYLASNQNEAWATAPVHLPQQAKITKFECYMRENDTSGSIDIKLNRENNAGVESNMAALYSSNSVSMQLRVDTIIGAPVVDNKNYSYHIVAHLRSTASQGSPTLKVYKCLITYTLSGISY